MAQAAFSVSFNITQWQVASTRLHTHQDWQQWANHQLDIHTRVDNKPELTFMPPIQKRRLSLSARLMFQATNGLINQNNHTPIITVSRDGEIARNFELWLSLLRDKEISPTSFGLSVHNALVGQLSMFYHNTNESSALSSQQSTLETAIVEACGILSETNQPILIICIGNPLPTQYNVQPFKRTPFPYALAMLIEPGKDWQLSMYPHITPLTTTPQHHDSALTWLQNIHQNQTAWQHNNQRQIWQWQRI